MFTLHVVFTLFITAMVVGAFFRWGKVTYAGRVIIIHLMCLACWNVAGQLLHLVKL